MTDYFLRFENEEQALPLLELFENVDMIGTIYEPTGETKIDKEGTEYPEVLPIPGFHVNIRTSKSVESLADFLISVNNPVRVWF